MSIVIVHPNGDLLLRFANKTYQVRRNCIPLFEEKVDKFVKEVDYTSYNFPPNVVKYVLGPYNEHLKENELVPMTILHKLFQMEFSEQFLVKVKKFLMPCKWIHEVRMDDISSIIYLTEKDRPSTSRQMDAFLRFIQRIWKLSERLTLLGMDLSQEREEMYIWLDVCVFMYEKSLTELLTETQKFIILELENDMKNKIVIDMKKLNLHRSRKFMY